MIQPGLKELLTKKAIKSGQQSLRNIGRKSQANIHIELDSGAAVTSVRAGINYPGEVTHSKPQNFRKAHFHQLINQSSENSAKRQNLNKTKN